jgi:hypothetical protein
VQCSLAQLTTLGDGVRFKKLWDDEDCADFDVSVARADTVRSVLLDMASASRIRLTLETAPEVLGLLIRLEAWAYVRHTISLLTCMAHNALDPAAALATLMPTACIVDAGVGRCEPRKPLRLGLAHVALGHGALQPRAEWMKHELARDALRDVLGALLVHGT